MCDASRQLQRIGYELRLQRGNGVIDLGKLEGMTRVQCDEHPKDKT